MACRSLHATLCFLGARPEPDMPEIAALVERVTGDAHVAVELAGALWLPPRRPRVLAVRLGDAHGAVLELHAALVEALVAGGFYAPESRALLPHVTVARVRRGARVHTSDPLAPAPRTGFEAGPVTLYRSWPQAGGARYEAIRAEP
ncbi:MAG: 2,3-cyclic 3-phosphodiesterase [Solirubrobacteraceae bacterium]|nr:2,3-cyclic 3-phosphodiesterase [Solirubrobacteraceae bacterium]